jgi:hypothetical protein
MIWDNDERPASSLLTEGEFQHHAVFVRRCADLIGGSTRELDFLDSSDTPEDEAVERPTSPRP